MAEKTKMTKTKKTKKTVTLEPEELPIDERDQQIATLQEQVRLLKIEVDTLRGHVIPSPTASLATPRRGKVLKANAETPSTPRRDSITSAKALKYKSCTCKGYCSTKICGCVKKDLYCAPTCKCSDRCKNQDPNADNDNDKENEQDPKKQNKENVPLSSARTPEPKNNNENKNKKHKDNHNNLENDQKYDDSENGVDISPSSDVSTQTDEEENQFNPMKPRHQLARSPLTKSNKKQSKHPALSETPFPAPKDEPEELSPPPPEEINKAEVDWEQHMAQLVRCYKCKRMFYPHRLKKHEDACLKI